MIRKILRYNGLIVDSCPNCDSAWTGGHPNPQEITYCIICGNRKGEVTGWVWGRLVDPFLWINKYIVSRNIKNLDKAEK